MHNWTLVFRGLTLGSSDPGFRDLFEEIFYFRKFINFGRKMEIASVVVLYLKFQ